MKKVIIIFLLLTGTNLFAQSGWVQQSSGTGNSISDIQFVNVNTGYAVGGTQILKSTNGGTNWFQVYSSSPTQSSSLYFLNESTGFLVNYSTNHILKTTNGGINWISFTGSNGDSYLRISFTDQSTGYIVGYNSVQRTTNAGDTWTNLAYVSDAIFQDVAFINSSTGFVLGSTSIKTTNGGANWISLLFQGYGVTKSGTGNLFVCGSGIQQSTDGGVNWNNVLSGSTLFGIKYIDGNNAVTVGAEGKILKTTNNGQSWITQQSNVSSTLNRVFFINLQTGWICGNGGVLLKTTTGGVVTGFSNTSNEMPSHFSLSQNYPNPFNPTTNIKYFIPEGTGNDLFVQLKVYDVNGKEIETLINDNQNAGSYSVSFNAANYPSGIYFYKLEAGSFSETRKMILLK